MKTRIVKILLGLVVGMLLSSPVWAQRGMGRTTMQTYMMKYDPNTVETVSGEVTDVVYIQKNTRGQMTGVHILVKTASETIPVHLGPVWYIENQEQFKKGDQVTVTGSRITLNNSSAIVAAQIVRGEMTLRLRDQNGFPAWRGWRQNRAMN